jgi:hypothetical protein
MSQRPLEGVVTGNSVIACPGRMSADAKRRARTHRDLE